MKYYRKVIGYLVSAIVGALISISSYEFVSNFKNERILSSILSSTIESIRSKRSEITISSTLPIVNYDFSDTLLFYDKPIILEYDIFYDNLLRESDLYLKMDVDFYIQLLNFKKNHKRLLEAYANQLTDSLRNNVKEDIRKQLAYEEEILRAEVDFLDGRISQDSLQLVRDTSFRKYL